MSDPRETLRAALDPRSVAIVGASENPNKIGGRPILYLARHGYGGMVYPINPNRSEVQGRKAFPDLLSLPDTPEVAIIALAGDAAVDAVEICAGMGVKVAVVMTSARRSSSRNSSARASVRSSGPSEGVLSIVFLM